MKLTAEELRTYDGIHLMTDIYSDEDRIGWVSTDRKTVTITGSNGGWAEISLKRRRPTALGCWRAALKVWGDRPLPSPRPDGCNMNYGTSLTEE